MKPFRCKTCGESIGWNDKGCDNCGHLVAFDTVKRRIVISGIALLVTLIVVLVLWL